MKDEVIRLIQEDYIDIEIKEKTGVGTKTISKLRKELNNQQEPIVESKKGPLSFTYTLTPEQTKRLYGICHLEGGKKPSTVIDELLEGDSKLRNKPHEPLQINARHVLYIDSYTNERTRLDDWIYIADGLFTEIHDALCANKMIE